MIENQQNACQLPFQSGTLRESTGTYIITGYVSNGVKVIKKMNEVMYALPGYKAEIISVISKRKWLVHSFNIENEYELYNPSNYLYNAEFTNTKYTLGLDLNIYQFLLNISKKDTPKDNFRDAAALLVFCQMANIEIDPTYPVYEKVNYNGSNLSDALPDLELFYNLNNSEMDDLAKYALGYSDEININRSITRNHGEIGKNLIRYRRLKEWDSLYLMMLSIIDINIDESIPRKRKLEVFLDWLVREFRISLVATIYAMVLFGEYPIKRMMKYKISQDAKKKRWALSNMTWDLYIMNQFSRKWTDKGESEEFFYASDDKAFRSLFGLAIEVQRERNFEPVKSYLSEATYGTALEFLELDVEKVDRAYKSEAWGPEYRETLIAKYEKKLFQ